MKKSCATFLTLNQMTSGRRLRTGHVTPTTRFCSLVVRAALRYFANMQTLTVEEAVAGLGRWVERTLAGEQIQIRQGDAVVELRPASPDRPAGAEQLSPREALRRLQEEAHLKPEQAEQYLREVREERRAAEDRRPA
jgi:antitoxin (DNA-binding transcriptional repressor) of toxin-antitoxin stability system